MLVRKLFYFCWPFGAHQDTCSGALLTHTPKFTYMSSINNSAWSALVDFTGPQSALSV